MKIRRWIFSYGIFSLQVLFWEITKVGREAKVVRLIVHVNERKKNPKERMKESPWTRSENKFINFKRGHGKVISRTSCKYFDSRSRLDGSGRKSRHVTLEEPRGKRIRRRIFRFATLSGWLTFKTSFFCCCGCCFVLFVLGGIQT